MEYLVNIWNIVTIWNIVNIWDICNIWDYLKKGFSPFKSPFYITQTRHEVHEVLHA